MVGAGLGHHLVLRFIDDRVIAPDAVARRRVARVVLRIGRAHGLLAFGAADTHLHVLTTADRVGAGKFAHALEIALHAALGVKVPFEAARIRPIADQRHLVNAFAYVQGNAARHGVIVPEATEASSLHDLLGLRVGAEWLAVEVQRRLPRTDRELLRTILGMPGLPARAELPFGPEHLDAAAAVLSLPDLRSRTGEACEGRRAIVAVAGAAIRPELLASVMGVTDRAVRRLADAPADAKVVEALRRQLAWRAALGPPSLGPSGGARRPPERVALA